MTPACRFLQHASQTIQAESMCRCQHSARLCQPGPMQPRSYRVQLAGCLGGMHGHCGSACRPMPQHQQRRHKKQVQCEIHSSPCATGMTSHAQRYSSQKGPWQPLGRQPQCARSCTIAASLLSPETVIISSFKFKGLFIELHLGALLHACSDAADVTGMIATNARGQCWRHGPIIHVIRHMRCLLLCLAEPAGRVVCVECSLPCLPCISSTSRTSCMHTAA